MANIVLRLSTGNAASTNLANQNGSLGGKPAASGTGNTQITIPENSFIMNILYDNITSSENMAEVPEYRCVYIDNSATGANQSAFLGSKIYVSGSTYAEFQLGKVAAKNTDAGVIANETTAPAGITFATYNRDNKMVIGDLLPGERYAIWIKRTPKNIGGAGSTQASLDLVIEGSE